ncbi:site-specific integrase [Roseococcus suduntuyensis]
MPRKLKQTNDIKRHHPTGPLHRSTTHGGEEVPRVPCLARLNGGPWGLRRRVPDELRPIIGKREIWVSYKTDSFADAKRRHHREMAVVDALFEDARKRLASGGDPSSIARKEAARIAQATVEDIHHAARAWFHAEEGRLLDRWRRAGSHDGGTAVEREDGLHALQDNQAAIHGPAGEEWAAEAAQKAFAARNLTLPPGALFAEAVEAFHAAAKEAVDRAVQRWGGRPVEPPRDRRFADVTAGSPAPVPPPPAVTLRALCDAYLNDPERADISPKTRVKYVGSLRLLCDLIGEDRRADSITREDCRRVRTVLLTYPTNAVQRYPGLTARQVAEAAARDGVPPMSAKTLRHHLDILATLFRWGEKEKVIRLPDGNPAVGLQATTAKNVTARKGEDRRPFTPAELTAIFKAPLYIGCENDEEGYHLPGPNHPRRGRFWVPLLGLYAGLRLNEACQLLTADVEEVDGVHVIHVRATTEGQRLKTKAAERRIPVHPELQRIGFLHLVSRQRLAGEVRLFPDLRAGKLGNYSDPFSKWFARFLDKVGVKAPGAVFHSFRHGFRDRMTEAGIPDSVADLLGGWTAPGRKSEGGRYGEGGSVRFLAEHVARITYPGLNLDHLHLSNEEAS